MVFTKNDLFIFCPPGTKQDHFAKIKFVSYVNKNKQGEQNMRKSITLIFCILLLSIQFLQAQKTVISGKITEAKTGIPIPYATIVFKGTYIGTMSDLNGNFNLSTLTPTNSV